MPDPFWGDSGMSCTDMYSGRAASLGAVPVQQCPKPSSWAQVRSRLPEGVDGWGYSLKGMMGMVVVGGFLIAGTYWALQRTVVPKVQARQPKKKKAKPQMGVGESFQFLAKSPYIRDLALLVRAP